MKTPSARKLPSGQWRVQLMIDGQRLNVTRPTKQAAEREATLLKAEHLNGIRNAPTGGSVPLRDAIAQYIDARDETLSPSTIRGYKEIARNRFQSVMGRPIGTIAWQRVINEEHRIASAKTIKNAYGLIRSVYRENGLELPPVTMPAPEGEEKAYLTPEQIPVFLAAVKGQKCEIPALLALSSLRKSELLALTWENIDLENRVLHVRGAAVRGPDETFVRKKQTKTTASFRDVPIIQPLYEALDAETDKTGLVIRVHYQTPYKQIQAICEKTGLPLAGLHGLRHSFASLCYSLGLSEMECMSIGGWSDIQTMRRIYTHLAETARARAANRFTEFFKPRPTELSEIYESQFTEAFES